MAIRKGVFVVNGVERILFGDPEKDSLADVLRRTGLTSVKLGCGTGQCGVCTIILDGKPCRACIKKYGKVAEHSVIETLEGFGTANNLHPLQQAWITYGGVQCGFCTPGFIVSAKALLDVNPNPTRQDVRDWFTKNNNLCRCTGYKQLVDAVMAAAAVMRGEKTMEDITFKIPNDGQLYHTKYPRPDALGKVLGVTDYADDIRLKMPEGMLEMAVHFSDKQHAKILAIHTEEAEAMPGVVAVLTYKDVKGSNNMGPGIGHKRSMIKKAMIPVLAGDKVRRKGDPIAVVVAETREIAREAAKKVKVDYEDLPVYRTFLDACKPGAVGIHSDDMPNDFLKQPLFKGKDTRAIFAKANQEGSGVHAVEGSFYSSRQPHLMLEPWCVQGYYDEDGLLTVNYKAQNIWASFNLVPDAIGIPKDKFRMVGAPAGASFGASMDNSAAALMGVAVMAVGKPINWTTTYEETQRYTGKRAASFCNIKLACDDDGKMLAMDFDGVMDHGATASSAGNLEGKMVRFYGYNYNIPNMRGLARGGLSNQAYGVAYRAYGSPQVYTGGEQIVDMLAHKMGIDPFEFRMRNLIKEGDTTPNGSPYRLYAIRTMMERMKPYYDESMEWAKQPSDKADEGWVRGAGIAIGGYHVSTPADRSEVAVELLPNGNVRGYNCWEEVGQGASVGAKVHLYEALRPLGLREDQIEQLQNDTKYCPPTGPASGSRSHYMAGNATLDACSKLLDAMRKEDGTFRTYDEMVAEGSPTKYSGVYSNIGQCTPINEDDGTGNPVSDQNFIVTIARVEVNKKTGKIQTVALHALVDVGIVGNFLTVDGQGYSAMEHSIGFALSEDYYDDVKKCGSPLGCGFPRCNDIPDDLVFEYQETPRQWGPHGSGGASESFQSCTHVSVINAVYNACGVRIYEIPGTPDKILAGLKAIEEGREYKPATYDYGSDFDEILDDIRMNPVTDKRGMTKEEIEAEIASGGH